MQVIYLDRMKGKTTRLIKISAEKKYPIVCFARDEAYRISKIAEEMKLKIPFPLSFGEFMNKRYCGKHIDGFLIDNADMLLQYLTSIPIKAITLTKE